MVEMNGRKPLGSGTVAAFLPAVVLLALSTAVGSRALAEPVTLVVPLSSEVDEETVREIEALLQERAIGVITGEQAATSVSAMLPTCDVPFDLTAFDNQMERGLTSFLYMDYQAAISCFENLLSPIFADPTLLACRPVLSGRVFEGGITLFRALLLQDREQEARVWMEKLTGLFPTSDIDPQRHPPEVVTLYSSVRDGVLALAPTLTIEVLDQAAADCSIQLNGVEIGYGPSLQLQASPGQHALVAQCATVRSLPHVLTTPEQSSVVLAPVVESHLQLSERLSLANFPGRDRHLPHLARLLNHLTSADLLVFVRHTETEPPTTELLAFNGAGEESGRVSAPRPSSREALNQVLDTLLKAPVETDATMATEAGEAATDTTVWAWVMLGSGAALLAGGAILFALGEADHQQIEDASRQGDCAETMTWAEASELAGSGDDKKLSGYVLWGVGGACVVGAVVLFLLEPESSPQPMSFGVAPILDGAGVWYEGRF